MSRKLKVFGGNYDGRYRGVVAAPSQRAAVAAINKHTRYSLHHFREFWCETGNDEEIKLAMDNPGVVFVQSYQHGDNPWLTLEWLHSSKSRGE